jgi:hypothetical protein
VRYRLVETVHAAQTFLSGQSVVVSALNLATDSFASLNVVSATESTQVPGLFIWSSENLSSQPTAYTEYAVVFEEQNTGAMKISKMVLGGYPSTITTGIAALNDLSIADVQTALTNQGYTTVRATLLDNLDQAISTTESNVLASIAALNDISVADIMNNALSGSGETVDVALSRLDNIDNSVTGITAIVTNVSGSLGELYTLVRGGRDIDFAGNDSLGWQRIERNAIGTEVERYNLFDQDDNRITGTVASFISDQKMIAKEVRL